MIKSTIISIFLKKKEHDMAINFHVNNHELNRKNSLNSDVNGLYL